MCGDDDYPPAFTDRRSATGNNAAPLTAIYTKTVSIPSGRDLDAAEAVIGAVMMLLANIVIARTDVGSRLFSVFQVHPM